MISKKVLLASICFIILLAAVGAYSYVEVSRLNNHMSDLESQVDSLQETVSSLEDERDSLLNHVSTLESQVEELQEEIDSMKKPINSTGGTRTFVFEWSPEQQNIMNGTLRMELIFTWKEGEENLTIIARVNDDECDAGGFTGSSDFLGIVLDRDDDGQLDGEPALVAYVDNYTRPAIFSGGQIVPAIWPKEPSKYHTCFFEPDVGYTFNASFPLTYYDDLGNPQYTSSDLIYVCYKDVADAYVYVRFHFGRPLEVS